MSAQICRENLLAIVAAYRKATGLSLGYISQKFYGSSGFLKSFKNAKGSVSIHKFFEVIDRFRAEWPPNAEWPTMRAILIPGPNGKDVHKKSSRPATAAKATRLSPHHER